MVFHYVLIHLTLELIEGVVFFQLIIQNYVKVLSVVITVPLFGDIQCSCSEKATYKERVCRPHDTDTSNPFWCMSNNVQVSCECCRCFSWMSWWRFEVVRRPGAEARMKQMWYRKVSSETWRHDQKIKLQVAASTIWWRGGEDKNLLLRRE